MENNHTRCECGYGYNTCRRTAYTPIFIVCVEVEQCSAHIEGDVDVDVFPCGVSGDGEAIGCTICDINLKSVLCCNIRHVVSIGDSFKFWPGKYIINALPMMVIL